jgi:APA family basic amino acid/polyamine antiporter
LDSPLIDPHRETERNRMVDEHIIPRGTVLMIFSALAVGAVPILRRREPDPPRPCRTLLYPFVPGFFILVSTVIVGSALL